MCRIHLTYRKGTIRESLPLRHTKNSPRKQESIPWLVIRLPLLQTSYLALPADAEVVARFYDVFLLLLATGVLPVDSLHCFGSGSFSKCPFPSGTLSHPSSWATGSSRRSRSRKDGFSLSRRSLRFARQLGSGLPRD